MRMMRLALLACTAVFVLAHLSLIAAVRAQAPNPSAAEKDKAKAEHRPRRGSRRAECRDQGGHPGHPRRDRQELGAHGQPRIPLRHDRPPADRLPEPDQGEPLDAGQVPAVRAGERPPRAVDDPPRLDAGRGQGPRGRPPSSSGCCWNRPAGSRRPGGRCAGRSSTSRPSRARSSRPTRGSSRGPGSSSRRSRCSPRPSSPARPRPWPP